MIYTRAKMNPRMRKKAQLNIREIDKTKHPLHLYINRKDTDCMGIDSDTKAFFISVVAKRTESGQNVTPSIDHDQPKSPLSYPFSPSASYTQDQLDNFTDPNTEYIDVTAFVWIEEEIPPDLDDEECLSISCGTGFPTHYQINEDEDIFIKTIDMFPLQRIVIGVTDFPTFKWLQATKFCTGLLTEVCQHPVFVKVNDIFLAPYPEMFLDDSGFDVSMYLNMHVLECCPLRQGILSINTEIILSFIGNMKDASMSPIKLQSPSKSQNVDQYPYISDFCQPLKPSSPDVNIDPFVNIFDFEIVQQKVLWRKLLCKPQKKITFDPNYVVGMSKQLMLQNGLFEESLVKVSLENVDAESVSFRFALVKCLADAIDSANKVFVSPLLIFNLQNSSGLMAQDISRANLKLERHRCHSCSEHDVDTGTVSSSWNTHLPPANEVKISIVISPNYSPRAIQTEAIKDYFRVPRVMTKGDIIPIRSIDDPEYCPIFSDSDVRYPVVFFKVIEIVGPQSTSTSFICDKNATKLIQVGSVHGYVPVIAGPYLTTSPLSYWDQTSLPGMKRYADELENLIRPHLSYRMGNPNLKDVLPSIMLTGSSGCGKTTTAVAVARRLNLHVYKVNCHSLYGDASGAIEARIKNVFNAASTYSPCMLLLHSIHALGKDKERNTEDPRVASSFKASIAQLKIEFREFPVIVVGTTHSPNNLTADVHEAFLHSVNIEVPDENDRADMLDGLLQNVSYGGDLSGQYLAQRTAGFVLGDMVAFVSHAKREAYKRVLKYCAGGRKALTLEEEESIATVGVVVQQENFVTALDELQAAHSDTIGAPKIPNVSWEDVGGLVDVKSEILDTIQLPLQYPELLAAGLRRSGVLFYGPPGTGKTLLAKAIATECSLNFLSVKGPELINMYVGQSEQNVREVFQRARSASPCVIFFDELDSLAPNRGKAGDSGGVMDRVVSQLLAELDGLHKSCDVFVIGATNRPDLLDPALLRPGRFDKMLYLGVSGDRASKLNIVQALTRKFQLSKDLMLESVVDKCPNNFTGADFYALCSDAMLNAIKGKIQKLESGETTDQTDIEVSEENFMSALANLTPSISDTELLRYEQMKEFFSNKQQKSNLS